VCSWLFSIQVIATRRAAVFMSLTEWIVHIVAGAD